MVFFATRGLLGPSGTNAGDIDVGTEVILNENGQPVNYLIVNQGIPSALYDASCEGTWLLRKDIRENGVWNASGVSTLSGSTIMTTMAGYVDDYDQKVQEAIKTVKIPYCVSGKTGVINSGANGLECKIFPPSGYEIGFSVSDNQYIPVDSAKLSFFELSPSGDEKRISEFNGSAYYWETRSVTTGETVYPDATPGAVCVSMQGSFLGQPVTAKLGYRPALILPYEFKFTSDQIAA